MSTFKSALRICGLSQVEASNFLGVSFDTLKKWAQGKRTPPAGVWRDLAALYTRLEVSAELASKGIVSEQLTPRVMNDIQADDEAAPLPGHGADVAGAMALLLAIRADSLS